MKILGLHARPTESEPLGGAQPALCVVISSPSGRQLGEGTQACREKVEGRRRGG